MGIGQVLTMPTFFASTHVNPFTYQVDILRALMLTQGTSEYASIHHCSNGGEDSA